MGTRSFSDRLALASVQNVKERDYWLEQLSGDLVKSSFPYDYTSNGAAQPESRTGRVDFSFPAVLVEKAQKLSKKNDLKLHMILVTGLVILLHKYTDDNKKDILIGSPILKQEIEGEFINTVLVFRNRLNDDSTFKELLLRVRETIVTANENQNFPIEILPDRLNLPVVGNEFPLFDVAALLENIHDKRYLQGVNFTMLFSFLRTGEGIEGAIEYNSSLYGESTVKQISGHYLTVLECVLTDMAVPLSRVELMSNREKKQVLFDFNNVGQESGFPEDKTLHELFAGQVLRTPDRAALLAHDLDLITAGPGSPDINELYIQLRAKRHTLTYRELHLRATLLALQLRSKGVAPGTIVGIILDPCIEMMVALLAVFEAGAAYLPIDRDTPPERIAFMLKDSGTAVLLTARGLLKEGDPSDPGAAGTPFNEEVEKLRSLEVETIFIEQGRGEPCVRPGAIDRRGEPCVRPGAIDRRGEPGVRPGAIDHRGEPGIRPSNKTIVGARRAVPAELATCNLQPVTTPLNLAYVIYTSGTTGKPKGVLVEHRNVVAYLHSFFREFDISEQDIVIQMASYAFDVFIEEVFPLLLKGGKIFIPHVSEMMDMNILSRLIYEQCVSIIDCTPLLLNEFNQIKEVNQLENVRIIISGGDVLKGEYVANLLKIKKARVYNTYGPTESTVCAAYFSCSAYKHHEPNTGIPIGKPVANYKVYILDANQLPLPVGVKGELCVAGPGVTRGYLNRPELTAEKFVDFASGGQKPFCKKVSGLPKTFINKSFSGSPGDPTCVGKHLTASKFYKTGDLARWLPDGNIEFCGRIDNQVKIRGFRIELGEVENSLRGHKNVAEAVVTDRQDKSGERYICAYIRLKNDTSDTKEAELRDYLSKRLPYYMIPAHFVFIAEIPLNRNGKIDKKKMPEPVAASTGEYVPPATRIEKYLADCYAELLDSAVEKIGINDNFFQLGGNSLKLIQLTTKVREAFGSDIPVMKILQDTTIRNISGYISGNKLIESEEEIMVLLNQIRAKKVFCFPPAVAYGLVYKELAALLPHYAVYAFNFTAEKDMLELYADEMIRVQPEGSFLLFAYSAGGKLCLKAANLLEKRGYRVSRILLMECYLDVKRVKSADFEAKAGEYFESFKTTLIGLGGEDLAEKVADRVKDYQVFFNELAYPGKVTAPIHYIMAGGKKEVIESSQFEQLTTAEFVVHRGFGEHEQMLHPGFVEKNAGIVNNILRAVT